MGRVIDVQRINFPDHRGNELSGFSNTTLRNRGLPDTTPRASELIRDVFGIVAEGPGDRHVLAVDRAGLEVSVGRWFEPRLAKTQRIALGGVGPVRFHDDDEAGGWFIPLEDVGVFVECLNRGPAEHIHQKPTFLMRRWAAQPSVGYLAGGHAGTATKRVIAEVHPALGTGAGSGSSRAWHRSHGGPRSFDARGGHVGEARNGQRRGFRTRWHWGFRQRGVARPLASM